MAAVATALVGDRYAVSSTSSSSSSCSSSSLSSSSGDTSQEDSSSSWSSSSSSSTWSSSASSSPSQKKRKKKKKQKDVDNKKKTWKKSKSTAVIAKRTKMRTKSSKSLVGRGVDRDDDNDEVGSMLLLGAELLKEVEEVAASSSIAAAMSTSSAAASAALMDAPAEPLPLPIGHYVVHGGPQNRAVLLEQVMSSVPAAQWQAILPPVLKEMNSAELKQLCLQQLQLLSDSAILNIINGGGDQGPAGKAVWPESGEAERSTKKRSKKSKKSKSKKAGKGERSLPTLEDGDDESSGKTLMELLELEMRARAIKALLKKEEEGEEGDEWPDDVVAPSFDAPPATPVQRRPLKTGEDSSSYADKPKPSKHAGHQLRTSVDPVPPTHGSRRPASHHPQTDDADFSRRDRHSSAKQESDQGPNKMRPARHYRHRHHERSRSPVRRAEPSSVAVKTDEGNKPAAAKSPSRSGRVKERRDNAKGGQEKCAGTGQVAAEEVEYEEEGIQEVDIELGSGSDDDANSARL